MLLSLLLSLSRRPWDDDVGAGLRLPSGAKLSARLLGKTLLTLLGADTQQQHRTECHHNFPLPTNKVRSLLASNRVRSLFGSVDSCGLSVLKSGIWPPVDCSSRSY
jgi:hypothetical protein